MPVELAPGDTVALDDVVTRLADAAYTRVDLVEKRGEFAVRGGLVDVFPPTEQHPVRVEFWGDEVDEVRAFAVADQRTIEPLPPAVGSSVSRAAADRGGTSSRGRAGRGPPPAGRDDHQDRRRHRRGGHGVAGAGARRRARAPRRRDARRHPDRRGGAGAGPQPRPRPGGHQRGVPGRLLGGRRRWWHRSDRPRRRVVPRPRRRARPQPGARDAVVDGEPVRPRRRDQRGCRPGRRRRPDRGLSRRPRARGRRPSRLAR